MISFNPKLVKNSIALLLALLCFSLPCLRVEASAECVPFSNGTDSVTVGGVEYFIDADNEDNLCTNEDVLLEEHIISLAKSHTIIYMLVYENGASSLSSFDTRDKTFKTLVLFESLVTSFAVLNQNIYFVLEGDIAFYNIFAEKTEILKASCDAELLYFSSPLTLKYYSKSRGLSAIRLDGIVMDSDKKENDDVYVPRLTAPEKDDPYYTTLNPLHRGGYGMVPNGGSQCAGRGALSLSGRRTGGNAAHADDEYHQRRRARSQQSGYSGIHDRAQRRRNIRRRTAHVRRGLPRSGRIA